MAKTETKVKDFKINYLSQAQYDAQKAAGTLNENELYMTPASQSGGGTKDHTELENRDAENQHPISAITGLQSALDEKQAVITDLNTIRAGASAGATAVQPETGKGLFSGNYNDLTDKPTIPQAVSESTVLGWGFAKSVNNKESDSTGNIELTATDVSARPNTWTPSKSDIGLGNVDNVKQYSATNPPPYPVTSVNGHTGAVTIDADNTFIATYDVTPYTDVDTAYKEGKIVFVNYPAKKLFGVLTSTSADIYCFRVLSSGSEILQIRCETTGWDDGTFSIGTYTKPTNGIPKSDLNSSVQSSLEKADSAYSASNPPPYPVTSVNGKTGDVTVAGGGVANTATLTTSAWTANSTFGFQQTVSVTGVTTNAAQVITVDVNLSLTDADANAAMLNAWALVAQCPAKQNNGSITFYAVEQPDVAISLVIGVGG